MNLSKATASGVVQWRGLNFFQELADHGADPHHLGRLINEFVKVTSLGFGALRHLFRLGGCCPLGASRPSSSVVPSTGGVSSEASSVG